MYYNQKNGNGRRRKTEPAFYSGERVQVKNKRFVILKIASAVLAAVTVCGLFAAFSGMTGCVPYAGPGTGDSTSSPAEPDGTSAPSGTDPSALTDPPEGSGAGGSGSEPGTQAGPGTSGEPGTSAVPESSPGPDGTSALTEPETSAPVETALPFDPAGVPENTLSVKCDSGTDGIWSISGSTLTFGKVRADSEYTVSGSFRGNVVIDPGDGFKFTLNLAGLTLVSESECPIAVVSGDGADISAKNGTVNYVYDGRPAVEDEEENAGSGSAAGAGSARASAIWSVCDTKLKGRGSLTVVSENNNGVHSKNDLEIKNLTLCVSCVDNCLKGNDSVTVESGDLTLIATGGDGIKTSDSDVSSKGNQRGTVAVTGGKVVIYAACDGIDAAYDAVVSGGSTVLTVFTDKYSAYTGEVVRPASKVLYLYVPAQNYSASFRYAARFYDDLGGSSWASFALSGTITSQGGFGGTPSGYLYRLDTPSGYGNVQIYRFTSSQTENSESSYNACTSGGTFNTERDTYRVTAVSGGRITGGWTILQTGGNSGKEYSTKGIKAANEISVSGGSVTVSSNDDCLHAAGGTVLGNGAAGKGDVTVSGGSLTLLTLDDAVHADSRLYISGGDIRVISAYEGLEANGIEISGGTADVFATDDGVNASGHAFTPYILVSGGSLTVLVGTGDTDGIDSNGSYTQTGGYVFTRSKTASAGGFASGLDLDGTCRVTSGTLIVAGTAASTPASGSVCWVRFGSSSGGGSRPGRPGQTSSGTTFAAGSYTVRDQAGTALFTFSLDSQCTGLWFASDLLQTGGGYTLDGPTSRTWTQSAASVTVTG
jgi:hypothetical protein